MRTPKIDRERSWTRLGWGVTVLQDNNDKPAVAMPDYIARAIGKGDIKGVLKWINANRSEDRANAVSIAEALSVSVLTYEIMSDHLELMTLLLQLGANVNFRDGKGFTAMRAMRLLFSHLELLASGNASSRVRLLLSWGATFFSEVGRLGSSKDGCISKARKYALHNLARLLKSEFGGRRCEIVNLSSRPELNGKTCVVDEYLPIRNQYKVTIKTKVKDVTVLGPGNLKRRDRTPQDCGYYIEFKKGRTIRHDFDSSEECQAFVAALNRGETQSVLTEEAEARAEQAAAELLAGLGLDDSPDKHSHLCKSGQEIKEVERRQEGEEEIKGQDIQCLLN